MKFYLLSLVLIFGALGLGAQEKEPLYWALMNNDGPSVWKLTQDPSAASKPLSNGKFPLVLAVERGWYDSAAILLDRGASAQTLDEKASPVVLLAARLGRVDLVRLLITKGADLNSKDSSGRGLWHEAALQASGRLGTYLAGLNLNVNAPDSAGLTPLHLAAQGERLENARLLVQKGADKTAKDAQGRLPSDLGPKNPDWDALWK